MAQDFTMYSGDTKNLAFTVSDSAGSAVNLTGATATWTLSTSADSAATVTKTSGAGDITYSGDNTEIATVALAGSDTASLSGVYYHELQITDASSNVSTTSGTAIILADNI